jgi:surface polysaccharide O-acyltransferase-like enzyme
MAIAYLKETFVDRFLQKDGARLSEAELSRAISLARIALIVGIVFLHYGPFPNSSVLPQYGLDVSAHQLATAINSFVLFVFFAAVPLLSIISGWLFFSFKDEPLTQIQTRIKRRIRSLYLPLILWNMVWLAVLLALFTFMPGSPVFHELAYDLSKAGAWDYINMVFAISDNPIAYQFWFVRDLFVAVLISPLLWLMLTRMPYAGALVLGAVWLAAVDLHIFFRPAVLFFFYVGGLLRRKEITPTIGLNATFALIFIYFTLTALRTALPALAGPSADLAHFPYPMMTRALKLVGVLACWGIISNAARTRTGAFIAQFGGLSFFLFCIHVPLIAFVKAVLWRWLPNHNDSWMLFQYVLTIGVTLILALSAAYGTARRFPGVFAMLNGGRSGLPPRHEPVPVS